MHRKVKAEKRDKYKENITEKYICVIVVRSEEMCRPTEYGCGSTPPLEPMGKVKLSFITFSEFITKIGMLFIVIFK